MGKSKTSEPRGPDRLSELPDSVIFHILWFVPMSDVIKTAFLSKRWRNLWTITTCINFINVVVVDVDDDDDDDDDDDGGGVRLKKTENYTNEFRNLINRALLCWNGERLLKFRVALSDKLERSRPIHDDVDVWLRFAMKNKVEELYLHLRSKMISSEDIYYEEDDYWVPQFLFSCSSLKELSLRHCNFNTNMNVEWNQLKSLTITDSFEVTNHLVSQILSGSPRLEVFILSFADRGESLSIRSRSLKRLSIYKFLYERDHLYRYSAQSGEIWMDTKLKIRTPNLESLEIKGIPYGGYLLNDVASLTHATLGCSGLHFLYEDHEYALTTGDFLGDIYSRILPHIQHVEHVTLLFCCMKVLGAMKKRCMHSSFPNVKSLQIGYGFNDYEQLVVLLESFPQLETLVLQAREEDEHHDEQDSLKFDSMSQSHLKFFEATLPNSFLLKLKRVEISWSEGDSIFPFMEIVLKFASKLEKMIFRVKEIKPPSPPSSPSDSSSPSPPSPSSNPLVLASQKLLKMQRTFPKCTIDIL